MAPHVVRLAEIDEQRFINACRHGLVHLTWNRLTVRFGRVEFRRLARLLSRSAEPPGRFRDGEMEIACSHRECRVQVGQVSLTLPLDEFHKLERAIQQAVERLDEVLDSGVWDQQEQEDAPRSILERLRQHSFSEN
jgi:hypothetical protein